MARDWWEDPDCPPLPDPPKPPRTSQLTCHVFPPKTTKWHRRILYLNAGNIPDFESLALAIGLTANGHDLDDIWIQFYRTDPNNPATIVGSPYEYYVTHIPNGATMGIDAIRDEIVMRKGASKVDASHLVYRSATGHVFRWPDIDCGGTWQMIVRWPSTVPDSAVAVTASAAVKYA